MLRAGGSATDAAIATMLALTVVEPQSSGIGGGGFFVHGTLDGTVTTIDGRETAPKAAGEDWFTNGKDEPLDYRALVLTGKSIGVPGNLRLAEMAHAAHGKLPWATLFAPAITLAQNGFVVSPRLDDYLERFKDRANNPASTQSVFFDEKGGQVTASYVVTNPALADTLRKIANEGVAAFYESDTARDLAATIAQATPGAARMTPQDIADYRAIARDPVCGTYRKYRICGMGPPSSGATTVLAILGMLERFDIGAIGTDDPTFWHLFAESQRLAYADRERYLADADFVPVPVAGLIDRAYLARRGADIMVDRRMDDVAAGTPAGAIAAPPDGDEPPEMGTSHFVTRDRDGNTVSYTSTIEGPFGSGYMFGGFYLNNELTDFSFASRKDGVPIANRVEGGKRPRSSMAPTVVYAPDGSLFMAVGAAGGGTIPVQTAKTIIGAIDFGLGSQDAIALGVLFAPGDTVSVEPRADLQRFIPALEALGHRVRVAELPLKTNAMVCRSICVGAADPRSEGISVSE